jgi:hypothetical protein
MAGRVSEGFRILHVGDSDLLVHEYTPPVQGDQGIAPALPLPVDATGEDIAKRLLNSSRNNAVMPEKAALFYSQSTQIV